ncbi:MAG: hypothetical protein IKQ77_15925 [Prevotella sp.]|nr:hypothetical protein [Prevotella sp.]
MLTENNVIKKAYDKYLTMRLLVNATKQVKRYAMKTDHERPFAIKWMSSKKLPSKMERTRLVRRVAEMKMKKMEKKTNSFFTGVAMNAHTFLSI